tara:strand:+ start:542 stop:934 length:393 start_codon:yes stop_codon:yes gene_type:complete
MVNQYVEFNEEDAKELMKEFVSELKNIHADEKGQFFYGTGKIPFAEEIGAELEVEENYKVVDKYIKRIKKTFKGNGNWHNMMRTEKRCGNVLRWCIRHIEGWTRYPLTCIRFPTRKSYRVNKYYLPDYCM